jgi:hypothetical protein
MAENILGSLDYGRIDEGADSRKNIVDGASQLGHGGHGCQGYHSSGKSVFHEVLPTSVFPNAIQEVPHNFLLRNREYQDRQPA